VLLDDGWNCEQVATALLLNDDTIRGWHRLFEQRPSYCPHLNPIERLWGVMHRNVTHNKCYATVAQFADATLGFLRENVPRNWATMCDLGDNV
jgi:hypothetical protein